jgi:hypothetical protein
MQTIVLEAPAAVQYGLIGTAREVAGAPIGPPHRPAPPARPIGQNDLFIAAPVRATPYSSRCK